MPTASIVFFYFGDSYLTTLCQETVPIDLALDGVDHKVVLKHDVDAGPFEFSKRAEEDADTVLPPTAENLLSQIEELRDRGFDTDLYVFAHGVRGGFTVSRGEHGDTQILRGHAIADRLLGPDREGARCPLRSVYQVNCWGASLNETWLEVGAKVVAGARSVQFFPNQFRTFITAYNGGQGFVVSVRRSEQNQIARQLARAYLLADALNTRSKWGGCAPGKTVMGKDLCAEIYFRKKWIGDDWIPGLSGRQNMDEASRMIIGGKKRIKKA